MRYQYENLTLVTAHKMTNRLRNKSGNQQCFKQPQNNTKYIGVSPTKQVKDLYDKNFDIEDAIRR